MRKLTSLGAVVSMAAVVAAGCGSGKSDTSTTPSATSQGGSAAQGGGGSSGSQGGGGSSVSQGQGGGSGASSMPMAIPGTTLQMDFTRAGGFYASPFPSEERKKSDGTIDMSDFPNPTNADLVEIVRSMLQTDARGFGESSGIYFTTTAALGTALPDVHGSIAKSSPVFLESVDAMSVDLHTRYPISIDFRVDGGPYGAANLLTLLPYQGIPLRPKTLYAAVVLRDVLDAAGATLGQSLSMATLLAGMKPPGMSDDAFTSYQSALASLKAEGLDTSRIAGLAVFRTDDPAAALDVVRKDMLTKVPATDTPWARDEQFDTFCVYHSTLKMPVYQSGTSPFAQTGGGWAFDASGAPIQQGAEEARMVVTIPRTPMPANGFPLVVLSRTGAGGDRPLVDRGTQGMTNGPPIAPGTGPALYYAHAGFAGSEIDGPLGGIRNTTNQNEDFTIFNVTNPLALRDNIRQSAAELALQAYILDGVTIDASDCQGVSTPDGGPVRFDTSMLALMGHSMGATISPLTLAWEPRFRAGILSGAGGSWIDNIIYKLQPLDVKPAMELILGLEGANKYDLHEHDPLLSMFQWAGEPADPPVYTRMIVREPPAGASPRHVLMEQGIVDHYILPAIANATSLSIGLDLAGPSLDSMTPEIASFTPLASLLDLVDRQTISYPVSGDITLPDGTSVTAMVAQHPADGIEDGHEIVFQTDAPKHQYVCYLQSLLSGIPRVPTDGAPFDPCE